jgi:hypothetical protein
MLTALLCMLASCSCAFAQGPQGPYGVLTVSAEAGTTAYRAHLALWDLADALGLARSGVADVEVFRESDGGALEPVVSQYDAGTGDRPQGMLTVALPSASGPVRLRLYPLAAPREAGPVAGVQVQQDGERLVVSNRYFRITHDPARQGGLPSKIEFLATGKTFEAFNWNDRLYDKTLRSFFVRNTPAPKVELVSRGPLHTLVRVTASYAAEGGRTTDTAARAVYEFAYRGDDPRVTMTAEMLQDSAFAWAESHFIEINFPGTDFGQLATSAQETPVALTADEKSYTGSWAALIDGANVLGVATPGARIYDGRGGYGTYLHGPWEGWSGVEKRQQAVLLVSGEAGALQTLAATKLPPAARAVLTTPELEGLLATLRDRAKTAGPRLRWAVALLDRAAQDGGRLAPCLGVARSLARTVPDDPMTALSRLWGVDRQLRAFSTEHLGVAFLEGGGQVELASLCDLDLGRELLGRENGALFTVELADRDLQKKTVSAKDRWESVRLTSEGTRGQIRWEGPEDPALAGLVVTVPFSLEGDALRWRAQASGPTTSLRMRTLTFPRLKLGRLDQGEDFAFVPRCSGTLTRNPTQRLPAFSGAYPGGWCAMQLAGYYDRAGGSYLAVEDPLGETKTLRMQPEDGGLRWEVAWNVPDTGVTPLKADGPQHVVATLHGDWFDGAQRYKAWVAANAGWWPKGDEERSDTPQWMKDVAFWACMSGTAANVVDPCLAMQQFMGVPTAVHWYSWHVIPFDDNYPHYFPAKEGFAEGVRQLHAGGVRVMPYINGRLWDSDTEDFPTVALPAATKDEKGNYYIEEYGSKQKLVPMCPTTKLWQDKVQEIVLRLTGPEFNVDGVYIDQIGAATPRRCFDAGHGHPLDGGHWWTQDGYWPMLTSLQAKLPPGKMITTECNAEPYCKWMDGYLSWHFQDQDMIPLFAAIYGGRVQIFSRAYRGSEALAHRMKAAQSLVFGEQIGWLSTAQFMSNQPLAEFFRRMARLRYALRGYLAEGEMARPPVLVGDIPDVTADWAWSGKWIITDTALQRAAWSDRKGHVALIFANSSDQEVTATLKFAGAAYGFDEGDRLQVTPRDEMGPQAAIERPCSFELPIKLGPQQAIAYEVGRQ